MIKSYIAIYPNIIKFFETYNFKSKVRHGNKSKISEFSNKSRKNLIYFVNSINIDAFFHKFFITLTYHNDIPINSNELKLDLKKFLIYSKRNIGSFEYLWKLELQKRKAPHFHLVYFFKDKLSDTFLSNFSRKISNIWLNITKCNCYHCYNYKTKVYSITDKKLFYFYVTKEIAKNKQTDKVSIGRFWGHSKNLTPEIWLVEQLSKDDWIKLRDILINNHPNKEKLLKYINSLPDYCELKTIFISDNISLNIYLNFYDNLLKHLNKEIEK